MDETTEPKQTRSVTPPSGTEGGVSSNSLLPRTDELESTEPRRTRSLTPPGGIEADVSTKSPSSRHDGTTNGADAETLEYCGTDTHQSTAHGDPASIGRYRVIRRISHGGYGVVYLARDDELDRQVAIKVSSPRRHIGPEDVEAYLAEGRALAKLDHPHIVPVYDVGRMDDGRCYVVSKFIEGSDLRVLMRRERPSFRESAELVATVAEALNHAHARGLVHRDVKPSNILMDAKRTPFLADFGLALREEDYGLNAGRILGTLAYMSPEQARGEAHLVDGRADIFSLGVVLYELLTGARPFVGAHSSDVLRAIATHDPRPPRQREGSIPRELERICLQAIAKQPSGRYATAKDFADDLRAFLAGGGMDSSSNPPPSIVGGPVAPSQGIHASQPAPPRAGASGLVPKGLRAFDEDDRDFFLALLPGPLDRRGLPRSLGFWKSRLEDVYSANPMRVGVVYGPSGCGKSSLIRAGLLPRLDPSLHKIVITATARSTEAALLNELAPLLEEPPAGLVAALQALRRGTGRVPRVLIVLDQFEQWLHGNKPSGESELVGALRQCDGPHVACLLIVRDDFWMSVHRLFQEIDIGLSERENCTAVDLFDTRHARHILCEFGRAYGALPGSTEDLSAEQGAFLDRAIAELAEDDRVICVRLALFAHMIRDRPWSIATLEAVGGARGVGIRFLEDAFGPRTSPLSYRAYRDAPRDVLRSLMPPPGTEIRASTRTAEELAKIANLDRNGSDFLRLIRILEEETRLLMPVDVIEAGADTVGPAIVEGPMPAYQLTHDYLVPSIREWLARRQRETWRGRGELRLEEREALWGARRERKQLPTLWEMTRIIAGTNPSRWTRTQAEMMRRAARLHGQRLLVLALLLVFVAATARAWHRRNEEAWRVRATDSLINRLMVAEIGHVLPVLEELVGTDDLRSERLDVLARRTGADAAERLRAEMALVVRDRGRLPALLELVANAAPATVRVVREWLAARARPAPDVLWSMVAGPGRTPAEKLRFAALLAEFDPDSAERWQTIACDVARAMVADPGRYREAWADLFSPASRSVAPALAERFLNATATPGHRLSAAQDLAKLGSTELLCRILPDADPAQFSELIRAIKRDPEAAVGPLRATLSRTPSGYRSGDERLRGVARRRNAAASLLLLGQEGLVWPLLESSRDGSLRTELIATMRDYGVPVEALLRGEESVRDPVARQALWLALAPYGESLGAGKKADILHRLSDRWPKASHQSERAAIDWLMRQWEAPDSIRPATPGTRGADWHVNSEGQTFLEVRGPVAFDMGSPDDEPQHEGVEVLHRRKIDRSFAISAHKVTAGQFHRYFPDLALDPKICPTPDCPVVFISWLDAARYCRRRSEEEGIPPDQMCYPRVEEIREDMAFPADFLLRTGYRLPTEAEWEYVCRAETTSRFFFGEDERHLSDYVWWMLNSNERTQPVGRLRPNPFGLFDIVGNSHEWCQDAMDLVPVGSGDRILAGVPAELRLLQDTTRVLRGANYRSPARNCRSAYRFEYPPAMHYSILGFRIARTIRPAAGSH